MRICRGYLPLELPWEFAKGTFSDYLPRKFAAGICRGYFPWVLCICKQIYFHICEQILFTRKPTFVICEQNFLICEIFFINSVSLCYCYGSYGTPYYSDHKKT